MGLAGRVPSITGNNFRRKSSAQQIAPGRSDVTAIVEHGTMNQGVAVIFWQLVLRAVCLTAVTQRPGIAAGIFQGVKLAVESLQQRIPRRSQKRCANKKELAQSS